MPFFDEGNIGLGVPPGRFDDLVDRFGLPGAGPRPIPGTEPGPITTGLPGPNVVLEPIQPPAPGGGGGGGGGRGGGRGGGGRGGGSGSTPGPGTTGNALDESSFIPDDVFGASIDRILQMLQHPGFPADVLADLQTGLRENSATRERSRLLRRSGDFAARGIFGSGVSTRDLERIETEEGASLRGEQRQLGLENARAALQSIQQALAGALGIGQLNFGERELEVREALQRAGLDLQRDLGFGQLDLGQGRLDLDRDSMAANLALQQIMLLLNQGGTFGGLNLP